MRHDWTRPYIFMAKSNNIFFSALKKSNEYVNKRLKSMRWAPDTPHSAFSTEPTNRVINSDVNKKKKLSQISLAHQLLKLSRTILKYHSSSLIQILQKRPLDINKLPVFTCIVLIYRTDVFNHRKSDMEKTFNKQTPHVAPMNSLEILETTKLPQSTINKMVFERMKVNDQGQI